MRLAVPNAVLGGLDCQLKCYLGRTAGRGAAYKAPVSIAVYLMRALVTLCKDEPVTVQMRVVKGGRLAGGRLLPESVSLTGGRLLAGGPACISIFGRRICAGLG